MKSIIALIIIVTGGLAAQEPVVYDGFWYSIGRDGSLRLEGASMTFHPDGTLSFRRGELDFGPTREWSQDGTTLVVRDSRPESVCLYRDDDAVAFVHRRTWMFLQRRR